MTLRQLGHECVNSLIRKQWYLRITNYRETCCLCDIPRRERRD